MADPAPALAFSHIEKRYGRITALDGVSFSVGAGEFVGLLGPNGSGKSTLFQIASGLFVPDGGDVEVFGRSYGDAPSAILSRIGVVFQTRSVDLDMSVLANLKFHGALFGLSGRELKQRVDEVVQLLGIEPARRRLVRELSGGNQRRVEIARALLNRPELLLMDEPSVGLDPENRRLLNDHIVRLQRSRQVAVLWATHLVDEVKAADRIVLLVGGKVAASGTPEAICAQAGTGTLEEAYLVLAGNPAAAA
jgi:ABC-2 type transport system ATP-binding protein